MIEGASEGHGLGVEFLRHIERTRVIVHLVDILPLDGSSPIEAYRQIRTELAAYSPKLAAKPEVVVANKMDLEGAPAALADLRDALPGRQIFAISAVAGTGLRPLLENTWALVERQPASVSEPFVEAAAIMGAREANTEIRPPEVDLSGATSFEDDVAAFAKAGREAPAEEVDAELAAEIEAIKADDVRKAKYYQGRRGPGTGVKAPVAEAAPIPAASATVPPKVPRKKPHAGKRKLKVSREVALVAAGKIVRKGGVRKTEAPRKHQYAERITAKTRLAGKIKRKKKK